MKDREPRRIRWASLVAGLALGGLAVAAMRVDFLNNYRYGAAVSYELASVMALAALGVTALPAVAAALRRWGLGFATQLRRLHGAYRLSGDRGLR